MKDKYLVSIVFIMFISLICFFMVLSCSAEEEDTIPPTSTVQSTTPEPETPAPVVVQCPDSQLLNRHKNDTRIINIDTFSRFMS